MDLKFIILTEKHLILTFEESAYLSLERFLQLSDEDPDVIPENIGKHDSMAIQNANWQENTK